MQPQFIPPVANPKKIGLLTQKITIIIIGAVLALVVGVGLLIASRSNDPTDDTARLQAMMQSLSDIIAEGRKNARDPDLVKVNADAGIIISGDIANLNTVLATASAKANKSISDAEKKTNAALLDVLKKAAIDGRFDDVYRSELITKLEATKSQLTTVYNRSAKPVTKSATQNVYNHLTSLVTALKQLNN